MNTPAAGLLIDERYALLAPAVDRGAGLSYRARDERQGGREVLVKFLRAMEVPDEGLHEALRALRAFRHESVPALLRAGAWRGRAWLAFEAVGGDSLGTLLDRGRAQGQLLELVVLRAVADAVLIALAAAHTAALPLRHGGLTPGSLIVRVEHDRSVRVRLLDLAIAGYADPPQDLEAKSARALVTAPPEVYAGEPATEATDVFALGALLREMFALPAPPGATLSAVDRERERTDVPRAVWDVIAHAMQRAPEARPPSVAALQTALTSAWTRAAPRATAAAMPGASSAPAVRSLLQDTSDGEAPPRASRDELSHRAAGSARVSASPPQGAPDSAPRSPPAAVRAPAAPPASHALTVPDAHAALATTPGADTGASAAYHATIQDDGPPLDLGSHAPGPFGALGSAPAARASPAPGASTVRTDARGVGAPVAGVAAVTRDPAAPAPDRYSAAERAVDPAQLAQRLRPRAPSVATAPAPRSDRRLAALLAVGLVVVLALGLLVVRLLR